MTIKERLIQVLEELSEADAQDVLRYAEARCDGEWWAQPPRQIVLDAAEADWFADALDHPERFDSTLGGLAESAAKYRGA